MVPTARSILHYPITASYRADTAAWIAAATGSYSTAEIQALDALLGGFATDGILSFDRLFLLQFGDNAADSLRCIVSLQSATTSATSPTFVRRQGWEGGVSRFINTNWAPDTGVNFLQDNASMGCYVRRASTATTALRFLMGAGNTANTFNAAIGVLANNTSTANRLNDNGTASQASSTVLPIDNSYVSTSRGASTVTTSRRNSVELNTTTNSAGRQSFTLYLLGRNRNGTLDGNSNHELSMAHMGAAQTTAQNASFRSRMDTFNTAIGFIP